MLWTWQCSKHVETKGQPWPACSSKQLPRPYLDLGVKTYCEKVFLSNGWYPLVTKDGNVEITKWKFRVSSAKDLFSVAIVDEQRGKILVLVFVRVHWDTNLGVLDHEASTPFISPHMLNKHEKPTFGSEPSHVPTSQAQSPKPIHILTLYQHFFPKRLSTNYMQCYYNMTLVHSQQEEIHSFHSGVHTFRYLVTCCGQPSPMGVPNGWPGNRLYPSNVGRSGFRMEYTWHCWRDQEKCIWNMVEYLGIWNRLQVHHFYHLGQPFSSIMLNPHLSARRAAALMMEATPELLPQIPKSLHGKRKKKQ